MLRKIARVTDAVVAEAALPDGKSRLVHKPEGVRGAPLYKLDDSFESFVGCGRYQKMEMIGHQHIQMKFISALGAVSKEILEKNLAGFFAKKQSSALPRFRRDKIGAWNSSVSARYCQDQPQRLKPVLSPRHCGTAKAVP
jgi:hypothetical protein